MHFSLCVPNATQEICTILAQIKIAVLQANGVLILPIKNSKLKLNAKTIKNLDLQCCSGHTKTSKQLQVSNTDHVGIIKEKNCTINQFTVVMSSIPAIHAIRLITSPNVFFFLHSYIRMSQPSLSTSGAQAKCGCIWRAAIFVKEIESLKTKQTLIDIFKILMI